MFNQPVSLETSNQANSVSADVSQANTVNNIHSNAISQSTLNEVQPNMNISSQNVVTAPTQNNDSNEVSEDTKKVISNAVAVALKKYNESKANKNTKNLGQSEPTRQEQPNVGINNESNLVNQNSPISDIPEVSFPNVTVPNTDIIDGSNTTETIASNMSQNIKPVTNQASFAQIVKMLRECADKIEQSGYFVNVDELDLGNQYKVTFTIDKE